MKWLQEIEEQANVEIEWEQIRADWETVKSTRGGNNAWFNSAYSLTNLIGSLGIQLTDWGTDAYFAEDSQVKNYAVDERYKLFMKYIADLYADGLINQNALTNDYFYFCCGYGIHDQYYVCK